MKPQKKEPFVRIPVTVDVRQREHFSSLQKKLWIFMSLGIYVLVSFLALFLFDNKKVVLIGLIVIFVILQALIRLIILSERRYMKSLEKLEKSKFQLGHDVFWDILKVETEYPYTVQFRNGIIGYFIWLEKGSIVGEPEGAEFAHHEAVADALKIASEKGLPHIHLDFSEVTSRDSRIPQMKKEFENSTNPDLKIFNRKQIEYLEWYMEGTVASNDVIMFYSREDDTNLLESIKKYSDEMIRANYVRVSLKTKEEIVDVAKTFLNLKDFDVNIVEEVIAAKATRTNFLRVLYTIDEEGYKEVINVSMREQMSQREIKKQERQLKRINKKQHHEVSAEDEELLAYSNNMDEDEENEEQEDNNVIEEFLGDEDEEELEWNFGQETDNK